MNRLDCKFIYIYILILGFELVHPLWSDTQLTYNMLLNLVQFVKTNLILKADPSPFLVGPLKLGKCRKSLKSEEI